MKNKLKFIILAVLALALLCNCAFALSNLYSREDLKKDFVNAMALFESGRYREAVVAFEKLIEIEKSQHESYFTPIIDIYIEKSKAKIQEEDEFKIALEDARKITIEAKSYQDNISKQKENAGGMVKKEAVEQALKNFKEVKSGQKKESELEIKQETKKAVIGKIPEEYVLQGPHIEIVTGQKKEETKFTAQQEEALPQEESAGSIKVFVNGDKIRLKHPVLIIENKIWMPLGDISKNSGNLLIDIEANRFNVIRGDGVPLEIEIGKKELLIDRKVVDTLEDLPKIIDNVLMVSLSSMDRIINSTSKWDEASQTVRVEAKYSTSAFSSYSIQKPKVTAPKIISKPQISASMPEPVPEKVRPDVRLNANVSSSLEYFRTGRSIENLSLGVNGKAHDYRISSSYYWKKDQSDSFKLLSGYINISRSSFNMRLLDNSIILDSLRPQGKGYKGMEITNTWDSLSLTGIFGTTETFISGTNESVKYFGTIYGLKEKYNLNDSIEIGGAILRTENEPEFSYQEDTTSFPTKNTVILTNAIFKLPYDASFFGRYATSNYVPDDKVNSPVQDKDIAAGMEVNKKKWNLKYAYELIGDKFVSVGDPSNYQDFEGSKVSYNYQIFDKLSIGTGYEEYHDNVIDDETLPTTDHKVLSTRATLMLPHWSSLNFSWSRDKTDTPKLGTGDINNIYRVDLSSPIFQSGNLLLSYEHSQTGYLDSTPNRNYDAFGINIFKFFQNRSYISLHQDIREIKDESVTGKEKDYNTELNYNYYFTQKLKGYVTPELRVTKGPVPSDNRNLASLRTGTEYQIDPDTSLNLEYRVGSYDLKIGGSPSDWSIICRLTRNFGISSELLWGKIEGMVFEDLNDNGEPDDNESGIAEAVVYLDKDKKAITNDYGYFYFDKVVPDNHKLTLDLNNLPINVVPKSDSEKNILVETKSTSNVNFPLMTLGMIQGRVFIDVNNNGSYDEGEDAVSGIIISLSPEDKKTKTDRNGIYIFEYLYAGTYVASLDTGAIPLGYQLVSPERWSLDLPIGGKIVNTNFLLRPKPVVFKTFPTKKKE